MKNWFRQKIEKGVGSRDEGTCLCDISREYFEELQLKSPAKGKRLISLTEEEAVGVQQIVLDSDKEEALTFAKEVVKKQIDRENASRMKNAV